VLFADAGSGARHTAGRHHARVRAYDEWLLLLGLWGAAHCCDERQVDGGPSACRYYGRNVGIKIMPTGVNCERLLAGLQWKDTIWRQGELKVGLPGRCRQH
jgi:hypothetical protein